MKKIVAGLAVLAVVLFAFSNWLGNKEKQVEALTEELFSNEVISLENLKIAIDTLSDESVPIAPYINDGKANFKMILGKGQSQTECDVEIDLTQKKFYGYWVESESAWYQSIYDGKVRMNEELQKQAVSPQYIYLRCEDGCFKILSEEKDRLSGHYLWAIESGMTYESNLAAPLDELFLQKEVQQSILDSDLNLSKTHVMFVLAMQTTKNPVILIYDDKSEYIMCLWDEELKIQHFKELRATEYEGEPAEKTYSRYKLYPVTNFMEDYLLKEKVYQQMIDELYKRTGEDYSDRNFD